MMKFIRAMMIIALGAGSALAADWNVGASAGYTLGGDVEENSFAPGAQATWVINETWSLEVGVYRFSDSGGETEEGIMWLSDVDAIPLTVSALACRPLGPAMQGYLGAGVAYYLLDVSSSAQLTAQARAQGADWEVDADNGYGLHIMAGVRRSLSEALSVFADIRYAVMAYDYEGTWTEEFSRERISGRESDTEDYYYGMLRIGLSWQL
jgi:outer membrane protein W